MSKREVVTAKQSDYSWELKRTGELKGKIILDILDKEAKDYSKHSELSWEEGMTGMLNSLIIKVQNYAKVNDLDLD